MLAQLKHGIVPHSHYLTPSSKVKNFSVSKASLLVIEDTPINQRLIALQLREDFDLTFASSGQEALEICSKHQHFQLILMDIGLPDMSGIEVTKKIRQSNSPLRHVPIIAHSAYLESLVIDDCRNAGMNAFLSKPSPSLKVIEVIQAWLVKDEDK